MSADIVGISYDPPDENKFFADAYEFAYRILSDVEKVAGADYEVKRPSEHEFADFPRRFSYLIDPEGIIKKAYVVRDVTSHADEVLNDLQALQEAGS